ncbi:hypothetical protein LguiA_022541 [Lonicera macranthoides]
MEGSTAVDSLTNQVINHNEESLVQGLVNSDNVNSSNSDQSHHDEDNDDGDEAIDDGDASDYEDDDDYMFDNDDDDEVDYLKMQAQFDNEDLPPGVEASVSWLKDPAPSAPIAANPPAPSLVGPHAAAGTSAGIVSDIGCSKIKADAATSSSTVPKGNEEEEKGGDIMSKFTNFKRFDIVGDFSDHHYNSAGFNGQQPPRTWTKKIQDEWKILEKDLPDTIYVRVYETRMDLLRAVIVGPAGTPYHDGLFVFDVLFPPSYPDVPPMVYYYSGGLRLNPNLYDCGKVCLSLLNTWNGKGNEKWVPQSSTMLQVLVSIQALILNAKPFFNEPGYESMYGGPEGEKRSRDYNQDVFILSLKTMMYTLRRPPKYYEDFVAGHFRTRAHDILLACRAYMEGAEVGSLVNGRAEDGNNSRRNSCPKGFKEAVAKMVNGLVSNFIKNGAAGCEEFRIQG